MPDDAPPSTPDPALPADPATEDGAARPDPAAPAALAARLAPVLRAWRRGRGPLGRWLAAVVVAGVVVLPLAVERGIEHARITDRVGTLPVEIGLAHNGYTTLDTGLLGQVYWPRTGPGGFGAVLRSTGPPLAGGTLASYVSPAFVRANTQVLDDPERLAATYGRELRDEVVAEAARLTLLGGVLGGTVLSVGWSLLRTRPRRRATAVAVVAGCLVGSSAAAVLEFRAWTGSQQVGRSFALPGGLGLSFSSPQTREIAEQVQPFIEKNTDRIQEAAARYLDAARTSIQRQLGARGAELAPREGETVIVAEADPQGSRVGTEVRTALYAALVDALPEGAVALRTIAGDLTSNGTVAEADFVDAEAQVLPDVPTVAAKGDHDTDVTVQQLLDADVAVPDTAFADVDTSDDLPALPVVAARDPAFKALFGGLVTNESGVSEEETGAALRQVVDDADPGAVAVVLHQPRAVTGYLGVPIDQVQRAGSPLTAAVDDGIPDLPPGIVTYGHLHDAAGPWVVWNTDTDEITWTVITQLGTAGGVEENPTFNRFSTPFSAPLKPVSTMLQYVDVATGLQTGYVPITLGLGGGVRIGDRVDLGLPLPAAP
ncbi:hypothetical protein [Nocardioides sp.]|uniref:hypothetical protein n=1 Tax=Nocardioides sp. TaxID=35761 RepID=UPI003514B584